MSHSNTVNIVVKTYHANKHATIIGIVLFWYILEKIYKYYYPQDSCSVLLNLIKVLFKTDDTMTQLYAQWYLWILIQPLFFQEDLPRLTLSSFKKLLQWWRKIFLWLIILKRTKTKLSLWNIGTKTLVNYLRFS